MSLPLVAGTARRPGWGRRIQQLREVVIQVNGNLKEIRVGIGWTVLVAVISGAAGIGSTYASLKGEMSLQRAEIGQLRSDLSLRDAFQEELRTLRDSIESEAHQEAARLNRSQEIDIQSIKLALRGADIPVEN